MKDRANEILRNIMKLLAARDKVLWENTDGWTSGGIDVPGIDEYFSVYVELGGVAGFLCHRAPGGFLGGGVLPEWSASGTTTGELRLQVSGERLTMVGNSCYLLWHSYGSTHSEKFGVKVTKIVGIEPIRSKILSGGGGGS